jgi:hypothetical protein
VNRVDFKPAPQGRTLKLGLRLRRDFKYFVKSLDKNSFAKLLGKYEVEDKPTFIFDN